LLLPGPDWACQGFGEGLGLVWGEKEVGWHGAIRVAGRKGKGVVAACKAEVERKR
jgi:hypothetical protein